MTEPRGDHGPQQDAAAGAGEPAAPAAAPEPRWRRVRSAGPVWALEQVQDLITMAVGIVLIALAAVILVAGLKEFLTASQPIRDSAPRLLDSVLLVLILIEIVHTVVLSLRQHRLAAQPFIVVGLIAVIRRILLVLTPGVSESVDHVELALLIGMVAVFIAGLILVSRFVREEE